MSLRNIVLRQSNCIMSFFLQEQRLMELLTHATPLCNIVKFSSVNLVRQLYLTIMVFTIYCEIL